MVELSLGDLLRWKPEQFRLAGPSGAREASLDQEISWAVSIRSTTPVLPPLRGDELVIVPERVLDELSNRESIGWSDLVAHLRTLPVSAVISDHPKAGDGIPGIVVFDSPMAISADLELELNREFTERRSSLYQLGSELARLFSSASIGGLDLSGFLGLAGKRTGIPLALMTASGRVLAASSGELSPNASIVADDAVGRRVSGPDHDWIGQAVTGAGLPDGVFLVAAVPFDEPGDRARLVLEQTGEALGLIFDRLPPVDSTAPRDEVGQIIASLATSGSLPSAARRRLLQLVSGIDLNGTLRVLADPDHAVGRSIFTSPGFTVNGVDLLLVSEEYFARMGGIEAGSPVVSWPIPGIDGFPAAVGPVVDALRLQSLGLLPEGAIDLGLPGSGGAIGALLALFARVPDSLVSLGAFADAMLVDLEAYDRTRDMRLVETLGAYLDAGATVATASERLGIHRNTLSYRIARISEVGGHDLSDPSVRFNLHFAISIRRLQSL
ncbi:MAG: helix-turn-helix domain-containing protein [Thermomicrobiales bacterium]